MDPAEARVPYRIDEHLPQPPEGPEAALHALHARLRTRRSVRDFSDRPVAIEIVRALVRCATTATTYLTI